ncbi:MAG: DedA family protein [Holosporaceae bacterium]|jgi:membrane protein YqaA with SNARE-associated domain|nr:DedA family protein [Holosporaceae bacterium]
MIEKIYDWIMRQAEGKNALRLLAGISFIESSFFPLPPDPVLAIVVVKNKDKALRYAFICAAASVLGGFFGYYIGCTFFELIGSKILAFYGQTKNFNDIVITLNKWAFWIICAKGLTPIPYKIVTIASGFAKIDIWVFAVASILTRGARFVILSLICQSFGAKFLEFFEKHKKMTMYLFVLLVVVGFLLVLVVEWASRFF